MNNIDFKDKKTIGLLVTVGVLVALTIGLVIYTLLSGGSKAVLAPDVTGMNKEQIEAWVQEHELDATLYEINYEFSEEVEKDMVISSSLEPETKITEENKLIVTVSNGKNPDLEVKLPDFKDMTEEGILKWFEENLFTDVTIEYVASDEVAKDRFIKINIVGDTARRSDMILVTMSAGTDSVGIEITMPDFSNYTLADIKAWAKTNNMNGTYKTETSDKVEKDKVISQSPKAGEATKTGSKFTVTISSGKGIEVIDFTNKTEKDVKKWATENGVKYSVVKVYSSTIKEGYICKQDIAKGKLLKTGGTLKVYVSLGKSMPLDDYTGKTKADFEAYIKGLNEKEAKLTTKYVTQQTTDKNLDGKIAKSSPAFKTNINVGTTITVTLYSYKAEQVKVPNLDGKNENDFKNGITGAGLTLGVRTDKYNGAAVGTVISYTPGKDTMVDKGTAISYVVSLGNFNPDMNKCAKGGDYAACKAQIDTANTKGAGWNISTGEAQFSNDVAKDKIIACNISGTSINCTLSKGAEPKKVRVPDYSGNIPCGAVDSCTADNLSIVKVAVDSDQPAGTFISQSIVAGTEVVEGTKITISISNGKNYQPPVTKCTVPNKSEFESQFTVGTDFDESFNLLKGLLTGNGFTNISGNRVIDSTRPVFTFSSLNPEKYGEEIDCATPITINIFVDK